MKITQALYTSEFESWGYEQHILYFDMSDFGIEKQNQPSWINIMRHPIERQLSLIYFIHSDQLKKNMTDFDIFNCFKNKLDGCNNIATSHQSCFLAGHIPACRKTEEVFSQEELNQITQMAKFNIENNYSVVGITDFMGATFKVLENVLPRFFNGSVAKYEELEKTGEFQMVNRFHLNKREILDPRIEELILSQPLIKVDFDIYLFVQRRLHKQYNSLF